MYVHTQIYMYVCMYTSSVPISVTLPVAVASAATFRSRSCNKGDGAGKPDECDRNEDPEPGVPKLRPPSFRAVGVRKSFGPLNVKETGVSLCSN
jgi:hypothetical protein